MNHACALAFVSALVLVLAAANAAEETPTSDETTATTLEAVIPERLTFDTEELFELTLQGITNGCLNWCVIGISFRAVITPFGVEIVTTPRIAHNNPDFVVLAHPDIGLGPWEEWSKTFGKAQIKLGGKLIGAMTDAITEEPGGGRSQYRRFGEHQALNFKEGQVIGSPVALLSKLVGGGGSSAYASSGSSGAGDDEDSCRTSGCLENDSVIGGSVNAELAEHDCENDPDCQSSTSSSSTDALYERAAIAAENWLADWPNHLASFTDSSLLEVFSYVDTIEQTASFINSVSTFAQMAQMAQMADSVGADSGGDRVLCPSRAYPFLPYYLSPLDAFFWRNGWPITNAEHAVSIFNPFSSDSIGEPGENWGNIYPRHGFIDNNNDQHVAGVIATRAAHIANDPSSLHIRWPLGARVAGVWQPIHPAPAACKSYVPDGPINPDGGYALNLWPRYECDMSTRGVYITTIYFPPICLL